VKKLIPFEFENNQIRTIANGDEIWVVAKDVAEALEYKWAGSATISHVPEQWKGVNSVLTPSGTQEMTVLSEQGLYFFLGRSDKPKALPFQMWLAGEVVPSIRKTGKYEKSARQPVPLEETVSAFSILLEAISSVPGVKPGIAAAQYLTAVHQATGLPTEPFRLALPLQEEPATLNPTQLGKLTGMTARQVNLELAMRGMQMKNERGEWELTPKGHKYAEAYPYARNGHASYQILWKPEAQQLLM
jgi:prophage antirepressor-like protein